MTDLPKAVTPPGQPPQSWAPRLQAAPRHSLDALVEQRGWAQRTRLLVLAAHPDDETLGCGRLMHLWRARGPVTAMTVTAGEACVDHVGARPPDIVRRRLAEWDAALAVLGARPRRGHRLPDGAVAEHEAALAALLGSWLVTEPAVETVLAAPWRHDPHPDHAACGRIAADVAALHGVPLIEYPVWMTYWTDPESAAARGLELLRLESDPETEFAVRTASEAFETQLTPLAPGWGPVVPPEMLSHQREQLLISAEPW